LFCKKYFFLYCITSNAVYFRIHLLDLRSSLFSGAPYCIPYFFKLPHCR
jgi:hypothetical protein